MRMVECVRSESDIYAPVSGEVSAANGNVETAPEKICQHVYQTRISGRKLADKSELMSHAGCRTLSKADPSARSLRLRSYAIAS